MSYLTNALTSVPASQFAEKAAKVIFDGQRKMMLATNKWALIGGLLFTLFLILFACWYYKKCQPKPQKQKRIHHKKKKRG